MLIFLCGGEVGAALTNWRELVREWLLGESPETEGLFIGSYFGWLRGL